MNTVTIPTKINKELEVSIVRAAYQVLSDPDFGLELSNKAKKRLVKRKPATKKQLLFRN